MTIEGFIQPRSLEKEEVRHLEKSHSELAGNIRRLHIASAWLRKMFFLVLEKSRMARMKMRNELS